MFALRVRAERGTRSRGVAIHRAGSPRRVVRSFRVHVGALAAGGELSGVARPSERETILAGSGVVEDDSNGAAATCGTSRRDESHSVGIGCGRPHRGRRRTVADARRAGRRSAAGRPRGGPNRCDIRVPSAAFGVRLGGFSRSCESPSKARGWAADPSRLGTLCIQDTPGSDFREFVVG